MILMLEKNTLRITLLHNFFSARDQYVVMMAKLYSGREIKKKQILL